MRCPISNLLVYSSTSLELVDEYLANCRNGSLVLLRNLDLGQLVLIHNDNLLYVPITPLELWYSKLLL